MTRNSMKIAILTAVYPPYAAGMATVAQAHARALTDAGHTVTVFTPETLGSWITWGNAAYIHSLASVARFAPDILILEYPFIDCTRALSRFHKAFPEVQIKIYYHMDLRASGLKGLIFNYYTHKTLTFFAREGFPIAASSLAYARASDLQTVGITEVTAVPLGADETVFTPEHSSMSSKRQALFVGVLDRAHAFKGIPVLLEALSHTHDIDLVIAGKGDLLETYKKQAEILGITDRVHFRGFVSDEELPRLYQQADVCVLPSTARSEAFGLVLVEAQLSGTPVIASNLPGVSSVVDPETGKLCTPGDVQSLSTALQTVVHKTAPNIAARAWALQFSKATTDEQFVRWTTG